MQYVKTLLFYDILSFLYIGQFTSQIYTQTWDQKGTLILQNYFNPGGPGKIYSTGNN